VVQLAMGRRSKKQAERFRESRRHLERYTLVRELRKAGATLEKAVDLAAKRLVGSDAAAATDTIEKSYKNVKSNLKVGRLDKYFNFFNLKDKRYRDLA